MIISTNEHDQHCYILAPMQYAIRLYNLMWDNVSMVNHVHLVKFVKAFLRALDNYGWITLKELYRRQRRIFLLIMGQGDSVPVQLQKYAYGTTAWDHGASGPGQPSSIPPSSARENFLSYEKTRAREGSVSRSTAVSSI